MFQGKTIENAESKNLFARPKHEYTKKLLNSSKQIENSEFYSNHEINKILNIENLNKNFKLPGTKKPLKAVNDLSFSLNEGEIFGIAGESGSGKTTVANLLMGLLEVNSGKITFMNKEINQYLKHEKKKF